MPTGRERGGIRRLGWRRRADDSAPGHDPDDTAAQGADPREGAAADDPAEASTQASLDQVLRHAAEARAVPREGDG